MTLLSVLILVSMIWLICCVTGVVSSKQSVWTLVGTIVAAVVIGAWVTGHLVTLTIR